MAELAPDTDWMLERVGIQPGERVIDLGCGPGGALDLLAKRVGPSGSVLGLERSPRFVELARKFVADENLPQVEVREGDAYETGLAPGSFDGAHMRLVLVNVPRPAAIVREMVGLVRPGGWVASFEADWLTFLCDPRLPVWDRLLAAFTANARAQNVDLSIGRRTHGLFSEAGVVDLHVEPFVQSWPVGNVRRAVLYDFIGNIGDALVSSGMFDRPALETDLAELDRALKDPTLLVVSHLFFRVWGRIPG